jgi:hypothetical protein
MESDSPFTFTWAPKCPLMSCHDPMHDLAVATSRRSEIIRSLEQRYPRLEEHGALRAVVAAVRALTVVGLDDDEDADRLVAMVAERRIRQRLGLDAMDARLNPQPRVRRSPHPPG